MAKKEDLKTDQSNPDGDLDFSLDFDMEDFASGESKKGGRNPVSETFGGVVGGISESLFSGDNIAKATKQALPEQYGAVLSTTDQVIGDVSSLYDEAAKEIKPAVAAFAKSIDDLVPESAGILKSVSKRLSEFAGNTGRVDNDGGMKDRETQAIETALGGIFKAREEKEEVEKKKEHARSMVEGQVEDKRFNINLGVLSDINENVSRMSQYTEQVTQAYQKKSLELQFRSYFALANISKTTKEALQISKTQNESIIKNTGLPEYVKIQDSERFKDMAKSKVTGRLYNSASEMIKQGMGRIRSATMNKVGEYRDLLEQLTMGAEAMGANREVMGSMGMSGAGLAGRMAGGLAGDAVMTKVGERLKTLFDKHPGLAKLGFSLENMAKNPAGYLRRLMDSKGFKEFESSGRQEAWIADLARSGMNMFMPRDEAWAVGSRASLGELDNVAHFDNKVRNSIIEVIPGYLSYIHKEIAMLRTGDDKVERLSFDHSTGKFQTQAAKRRRVQSEIDQGLEAYGIDERLSQAMSALGIDSTSLTNVEASQIKRMLVNLSRQDSMDLTAENLLATKEFDVLAPRTKAIVSAGITKTFADKDKLELSERDIRQGFEGIRSVTPDMRARIEELVKGGYSEQLEEQGIIRFTPDGKYTIDKDKYFENFNRVIAKSDINVKESITAFNAGSALEKIKSSKFFNWKYKKGEGDQGDHVGPMAQDIRNTFGEGAAPGGRSIDLVNLNGQTMAAVKELALQQDELASTNQATTGLLGKLKGGVDRLVSSVRGVGLGGGLGDVDDPQAGMSALERIAFNTRRLVMIAEQGGGLGGGLASGYSEGGNYADLSSNVFRSVTQFASKATGDLFSAAGSVFDFGKDNVAKPIGKFLEDAIKNNEDTLGGSFRKLLGQGADLASSAIKGATSFLTQTAPEKISNLYDRVSGWISEPRDFYLPFNLDTPVIRGTLLAAGAYRDSVTGEIITRAEQLKSLKGDLVDHSGNVIVSTKDLTMGLVDEYGEKVRSRSAQVARGVFSLAKKGIASAGRNMRRAGAFLGEKGGAVGKRIMGMFSGLKDYWDNANYGDFFGSFGGIFGVGFGRLDDVHDRLVEIRDILLGRPTKELVDGVMKDKQYQGVLGKSTKELEEEKKDKSPIKVSGLTQVETRPELMDQDESVGAANEDQYYSDGSELRSIAAFGGKIGSGLMSGLRSFGSKRKDMKGFGGKAKGFLGNLASGVKGAFAKGESEEGEGTSIGDRARAIGGSVREGYQRAKSGIVNTARGFMGESEEDKRRGGLEDELTRIERLKKSRARNLAEKDQGPKYKGQNIIDTMMGWVKNILGGLGSAMGTLLQTIAGSKIFGKLKALGGTVLNAGKRILGSVFGKGGGKGILGGLKSLGGKVFGKGGMARSALSMGARALPMMGSGLATAGTTIASGAATAGSALATAGTATMGALGPMAGAIGAAIVSPIGIAVLGGLAVAAVGYGAYKFFTRRKINDIDKLRFLQYGFPLDKSFDKQRKAILNFESLLEKKSLKFSNGQATLSLEGVDIKDIAKIFKIDTNDEYSVQNFVNFLERRFKPIFLHYHTLLSNREDGLKIEKIDSLKGQERNDLIDQLTNMGNFQEVSSPFPEGGPLVNTAEQAKEYAQSLKDKGAKPKGQGSAAGSTGAAAGIAAGIAAGTGGEDTEEKSGVMGGVKDLALKAMSFTPAGFLANKVKSVMPDSVKKFLSKSAILAVPGLSLGIKAFKYFTSRKVNKVDKLRFVQYGFSAQRVDRNKHQALLQLEALLETKALSIQGEEASLNMDQVDMGEMLKIFELSAEDEVGVARFLEFMDLRFKPIFLSYHTLLNQGEEVIKIEDIHKLKGSELNDLLDKLVSVDKYNKAPSPFDKETTLGDSKEAAKFYAESIKDRAGPDKAKTDLTNPLSLIGAVATGAPLMTIAKALTPEGTMEDIKESLGDLGGRLMDSLANSPLGKLFNKAKDKAMDFVESAYSGVKNFISSDTVLSIPVLGTTLYAANKVFDWFKGKEDDTLVKIRLAQYGLGHVRSAKRHEKTVLSLESYLVENALSMTPTGPVLDDKGLNMTEIFKIFKVDPKDSERVEMVLSYFNNRFKPFFLNNVAALYSVDPTLNLRDLEKLKGDELLEYLDLVEFDSGPYSYTSSPFKGLESLNNDPRYVKNAIENLRGDPTVAAGGSSDDIPVPELSPNSSLSKTRAKQGGLNESEEYGVESQAQANRVAQQNKDLTPQGPVSEDGGQGHASPSTGGRMDPSVTQDQGSMGSSRTPNMAGGPLADGSAAMQYLLFGSGVNIDTLNPAMKKLFLGMVQEYYEKTGKKIKINSGSRTRADQERLFRKYGPGRAARPGESLHEFGLALDIDTSTLNTLEEMGLMKKYGFTRPVGGETWHLEPAGIQQYIQKAKNDPEFASRAVMEGIYRGGGGYGSKAKKPVGGRNAELAKQLFNAPLDVSEKEVDELLDSLDSGGGAMPSQGPVGGGGASGGSGASGTFAELQDKLLSSHGGNVNRVMDLNQQGSREIGQAAELEPDSFSSMGDDGDMGNVDGDIKDQIAAYAREAGMDPKVLQVLAAIESSMNPNAKAGTSSATGLFQFIRSTWQGMMKSHASKYGINPNTSPTNVRASTLMAAEYLKQNRNIIKSVRSNPGVTDYYLSHFLGPGGARTFLSANPNSIAANVLPKAAASNKGIFYDNGRPRTIAQVYKLLSDRLSKRAQEFGIGSTGGGNLGSGTQSTQAEQPAINADAASYLPDMGEMDMGGEGGGSQANQSFPQAFGGGGGTGSSSYGSSPDFYGQSPTQSYAQTQSFESQGLNTLANFSKESVDVQKQMLETLQTIAKHTSNLEEGSTGENSDLKELVGILKQMVESGTAPQGQLNTRGLPTQGSTPDSAISLRRRAS